MSLLIEGCQSDEHAKSQAHSRRSSLRPKTAKNNMNLTDRTCSATSRPKSGRTASSPHLIQQIKRKSEELLSKSNQRHTTKERTQSGRLKYLHNNFSTLTGQIYLNSNQTEPKGNSTPYNSKLS